MASFFTGSSGGPRLAGGLGLLDLGPGVAEGDRPVEDQALWRRVHGVHAEVPVALELDGAARGGAGEARLDQRVGQRLERARVEVGLPVAILVVPAGSR